MNEYEVTALSGINFAPVSELEEILQNVRTIISTQKGTVPLDRDFGLDLEFIDQPINIAQARISAEVVRQINRYEPRARVISIELFDNEAAALNGKLIPRVVIGVNS